MSYVDINYFRYNLITIYVDEDRKGEKYQLSKVTESHQL